MPARRSIFAMVLCLGAFSWACHRKAEDGLQGTTRKILYYHDPMHPSYRSDRPGIAPDCKMELTPVYADETGGVRGPGLVRIAQSQASAIGLRTEAAREEAGVSEMRTLGRVQAQESRRYQVTAGTDGWIRKVHGGETGSFVIKGQALASYYSRDITSPQQAYLYALDADARVRTTPGASPDQRTLVTKQLKQARDYLEFLGMTERQIVDLEHVRQEGREVTLGATASGVVLERKVSEGARFGMGDVLWEIADIESVWITADVFPEDLAFISGSKIAAAILPDGSEYAAVIDSSLPRFDTVDRVAKLRLTVQNPGHKLLPGMTLTVRLRKALGYGLTVPSQSVIESGIRPRVFVEHGDGGFEARAVTTGWRNAGRLQILSGLKAGERVVVAGAFLIDSETRLHEESR